MKRQFLQMNELTVVSVLAIYSREQKVTYRDAVMKERQNFRTAARSLSRHKAVMQLPVLPLRYRVDLVTINNGAYTTEAACVEKLLSLGSAEIIFCLLFFTPPSLCNTLS